MAESRPGPDPVASAIAEIDALIVTLSAQRGGPAIGARGPGRGLYIHDNVTEGGSLVDLGPGVDEVEIARNLTRLRTPGQEAILADLVKLRARITRTPQVELSRSDRKRWRRRLEAWGPPILSALPTVLSLLHAKPPG
jgi:hypothetical protein